MKLEYIIPHRGNSLGKIFGVMEINKLNYFIADYSVSQTTLDQVIQLKNTATKRLREVLFQFLFSLSISIFYIIHVQIW